MSSPERTLSKLSSTRKLLNLSDLQSVPCQKLLGKLLLMLMMKELRSQMKVALRSRSKDKA